MKKQKVFKSTIRGLYHNLAGTFSLDKHSSESLSNSELFILSVMDSCPIESVLVTRCVLKHTRFGYRFCRLRGTPFSAMQYYRQSRNIPRRAAWAFREKRQREERLARSRCLSDFSVSKIVFRIFFDYEAVFCMIYAAIINFNDSSSNHLRWSDTRPHTDLLQNCV